MAKKSYAAIDFVGNADNEAGNKPLLEGNTDLLEANPSRKKLRWQLKNVPWPLALERISVVLSSLCLFAALIWRVAADARSDLKVSISRETLLFSRNQDAQDGMRFLHSTWNKQCNEKYPLLLQTPTWQDNESGVVMHASIYATNIYIWPLTIAVFTTSVLFQAWRCWSYDELYKPDSGPEFSRWLEYFFTSPLQILIVSSSFGFATVDALLGQSGMQAALVLLGYSIEKQVKKIYKRRERQDVDGKNYRSKKKRFYHILAGWNVADIRIWVFLFFSWALHIAIWGIPNVTGFGIGGKYWLMRKQLESCVQGVTIPDAVTAIYWLQYILFTLFGIVCSAHVLWAKTRNFTQQKRDWRFVSGMYSILSVSAKTALEVGLVSYVLMYKEWQVLPEANTEKRIVNNQTCWAINY
jgi:hypothetical protein